MKLILTIDPGAPKKRDKSGTTGVFVGERSRIRRLDGYSLVIESNEIDAGIRRVAEQIFNIRKKFEDEGHEVEIVIEEYKNYDWNGAANSFSKNEVSQLIGAIKMLCGNVTEQSTTAIKTAYSDETLVKLGLLEKVGNRYTYPAKVGDNPSSRHERDAYRHYLKRRKDLGYINRIRKVI